MRNVSECNTNAMTFFISENKLVKQLKGCQVAQSVERRTLEVEVRGSEPVLGIRIPPNQPIQSALRRRRPHYSQSGDLNSPEKD